MTNCNTVNILMFLNQITELKRISTNILTYTVGYLSLRAYGLEKLLCWLGEKQSY